MLTVRPTLSQTLPHFQKAKPTSGSLMNSSDGVALHFSGAAKPLEGPRTLSSLERAFFDLILNFDASSSSNVISRKVSEIRAFIETHKKSSDFSVNVQNRKGLTALDLAAIKGSPEITALLLEKTNDKAINSFNEKNLKTALNQAVIKGNPKVVALLLDRMSDEAINGSNSHNLKTALHQAARKGNPKVVALLLDRMSDEAINRPDEPVRTALHYASEEGHTEVVKLLLKRMSAKTISQPDFYMKETALHLAAGKGHIEVVKLLTKAMPLKAIRALKASGQTALSWVKELEDLPNKDAIIKHLEQFEALVQPIERWSQIFEKGLRKLSGI